MPRFLGVLSGTRSNRIFFQGRRCVLPNIHTDSLKVQDLFFLMFHLLKTKLKTETGSDLQPRQSRFSIWSAWGFHQDIDSTLWCFWDIIFSSVMNFPWMEANKPRKINKAHQLRFNLILHINWENIDKCSHPLRLEGLCVCCDLRFCLKEERNNAAKCLCSVEENVSEMPEVLLKSKCSGRKGCSI